MPYPGEQHRDSSNGSTTNSSDVKSWSGPEAHSVQTRLNKHLGPEFLSYRPAPGGARVAYIEGWKAINLANDTFGFNGWSTEIKNLSVDYCDELGGRFSVGVTCTVRVTLKDGSFHEDVGFGHIENVKAKYMAFDKCKKEATTDAVKRTLRKFGNVLGNCLYNQSYTRQVSHMKQEQPALDKQELVRNMDFQHQYHENFSYGNRNDHKPPERSQIKAIERNPVQTRPMIEPPKYVHRQPNAQIPQDLNTTKVAEPTKVPEPRSIQRSTSDTNLSSTGGPILDPDSIYKLVEDAAAAHDEFYDELDFEDDLMSEDMISNEIENSSAVQSESGGDSGTANAHSTPPVENGDISSSNTASTGNPNTPIKFFKASAATAIQQNSPVSSEYQFDPTFHSPSIRRTLPHNKSVPVKRSEVLGANFSSVGKDAPSSLRENSPRTDFAVPVSKALPSSSNNAPPQQSPVRPYGAPKRAPGRSFGRSSGRMSSPRLNDAPPGNNSGEQHEAVSNGGGVPKRPMADLGPSLTNIPVSAVSGGGLKGSAEGNGVGDAKDLPVEKKQKV